MPGDAGLANEERSNSRPAEVSGRPLGKQVSHPLTVGSGREAAAAARDEEEGPAWRRRGRSGVAFLSAATLKSGGSGQCGLGPTVPLLRGQCGGFESCCAFCRTDDADPAAGGWWPACRLSASFVHSAARAQVSWTTRAVGEVREP